MIPRPDRTQSAEYYFTYIDKVPGTDPLAVLESQVAESLALYESIDEKKSLHRYADGKWTLREVLSHINDTERLFVFRAFWFARGLEAALPSFDQDVAIKGAGADARTWRSHIDEFRTVRAASLSLFKSLPPEAWSRKGTASGNPFSVGALAYIAAGHVAHHNQLIRERYL
ncbi:MAG TPA: DinB family protein [Vicinamibacterales bacterium]